LVDLVLVAELNVLLTQRSQTFHNGVGDPYTEISGELCRENQAEILEWTRNHTHNLKWNLSCLLAFQAKRKDIQNGVEASERCKVLDPVKHESELEILPILSPASSDKFSKLELTFNPSYDEVGLSQILNNDAETVWYNRGNFGCDLLRRGLVAVMQHEERKGAHASAKQLS
jgi:hypothetical protein